MSYMYDVRAVGIYDKRWVLEFTGKVHSSLQWFYCNFSQQGEGFIRVTAEPELLLENRNSKDTEMSDALTALVIEDLKQTAGFTSLEYTAINRRIQMLPERVGHP